MSINSIKILIIGPIQSGKSTIANYISEKSDIPLPYRPTVGVRILEFEKQTPKNPKRPGQDKVMIELWDVSGDTKYFF
jgi:intraflagellar transport protein 22